MKREERYNDWDSTSLSDLPTEDIEPVNISPDRRGTVIPNTARELVPKFKQWIIEIYERTKNTGKEHGFYVDWYGNVIGIVQGTEDRINWPADVKANRVIMFHTHPMGTPALSSTDLDAFSDMNQQASQAIIAVPDSGLGGIYYTALRDTETANEMFIESGPELTIKYGEHVSNELLRKGNLSSRDSIEILALMKQQMRQLEQTNNFIHSQEVSTGRTMIYSHKGLLRSDLGME